MELQRINDQPKIPRLRTQCFEDLQIAGQTVRVHKPRARASIVVATRGAEQFGETVLAVVASPPTDEKGRSLAEIIQSDVKDANMLKSIVASGLVTLVAERLKATGKDVGEEHLFWYFETLLAGTVELDGHIFKDVDELGDAGFGLAEIVQVFWSAFVMAIYPTSGDPDMSTGSPLMSSSEPTASPKPQARTKSKRSGGTSKAGRSVRTRGRTGTSGGPS